MIVTKIGEPKRFDIVVFHASDDEDYIKRVNGLPGDRIEYKDDKLYLNGKLYGELYLEKSKQEVKDGPLTNSSTLRETPVGSDVVPKGHLFVMGDNMIYIYFVIGRMMDKMIRMRFGTVQMEITLLAKQG
ncbi:signal peptidase I [Bacillus sp. 1NLA3E]|nr:signal peptidase I [Bacillus sp. 1NLA3E]